MATLYSPKIVTDGLVLYLDAANRRSYSGSGTAWIDLSNPTTSSLINGPTFDGANGGSIVFDGSNDYVNTNRDLLTETGGLFASASLAWSVSAWFLPAPTNTAGTIVTRATGGGTSSTFTTVSSGSVVTARLRGGTIRTISNVTTTWHELVITWNGTTANAYYDGSYVDTVSVGTAALQDTNFSIGANNVLVTPADFFNGRVANVKVYNRALSATEILQNYNATRNRFGV